MNHELSPADNVFRRNLDIRMPAMLETYCNCWEIAITQEDKQSCMKIQHDVILELLQFHVNYAMPRQDRKYCLQTAGI